MKTIEKHETFLAKKRESCILTYNDIKITLKKRPFSTGNNLTKALCSIVESGKKEGSAMFECENDLRSNCDYEILLFKIC